MLASTLKTLSQRRAPAIVTASQRFISSTATLFDDGAGPQLHPADISSKLLLAPHTVAVIGAPMTCTLSYY